MGSDVFSRYLARKKKKARECAIFLLEYLSKEDLPPLNLKKEDFPSLKGQERSILEPNQHWVKSIDLFQAAKEKGYHPQTVDKILKEMTRENLICRLSRIRQFSTSEATKTKESVYYRLFFHTNVDLMTHQEHLAEHERDRITILKFAITTYVLNAEIEKMCSEQGLNYSEKKKDIEGKTQKIWNEHYKEIFGEWS